MQAIAKHIPTGEPTLDTSIYEMVLSHFLENSHEVKGVSVFVFGVVVCCGGCHELRLQIGPSVQTITKRVHVRLSAVRLKYACGVWRAILV